MQYSNYAPTYVTVGDSSFDIANGYFYRDVLKALGARFDGDKKVWRASISANTVEALKDAIPPAFWSREALAVCDQLLAPSKEILPSIAAPFPGEYKFKTEPRQYQREALARAYGKPYIAFDGDPGVGKSKIIIDVLAATYQFPIAGLPKLKRVLIVCPASIRENWEEQINLHCPLPHRVHCVYATSGSRKKAQIFTLDQSSDMPWLVIGVDGLLSAETYDIAKSYIGKDGTTAMVVDESHLIKTPKAQRTRKCIELGKHAGIKYIASGTITTQGAQDYFTQFLFLNPAIIGCSSWTVFKSMYVREVLVANRFRKVIGYNNLEGLITRIKPHTISIRKKAVLPELPDMIYQTRYIEASAEQDRLERELRKRIDSEWSQHEGDPNTQFRSALTNMIIARQISGGFLREGENITPLKSNPKMDELLSILGQTQGSVIIWGVFVHELKAIHVKLEEVFGEGASALFYGDTPAEERQNVIEGFQAGKYRFLVANPAVGGVGFTLTKAETMIYYSNSYSYAERIQSESRPHRIGQHSSVVIIDLYTDMRIDKLVKNALTHKIDFQTYLRQLLNEERG